MPDGACQPTWSPDGAKLVFTSPCSGPDEKFENSTLYIINADGTGLAPLLSEPGGDYDPTWSPDGARIVFISRRTTRPSIFALDVASQTVTLLLEAAGNFLGFSDPSWSPFNNQILFVADRGIPEIWVMTDNGENPIQLVYSGLDYVNFDPVWSPDGQFVRFSQRLNGASLVWLSELAYEERELLTAKRLNFSPLWIENIEYSPDGIWLLFEGLGDDKNRDIYLMSVDGETVIRITLDPGMDFDPAWRPLH
jgi:Tol biopolymer transport system component